MTPWNLTERESEVMQCYTRVGHEKIVGAELGISNRTVSETVRRVMKKMDVRIRLLALLQFDRWAREESKP